MGKILASILINLFVFVAMAFVFYSYRKDAEGNVSLQNIKRSLRFFTTLSNLFSALISLVTAIVGVRLFASSGTEFPLWVIVLKFVGTTAVAVTLLTVLVFLGPTMGYPAMFAGTGILVHLIFPVLSIISLCFLETSFKVSFLQAMLGILPMGIYGIVYLRQVVFVGEEKGGWEDFYGFNKGGKWQLSFCMMVIGTFVLCVGLYFLHNAMV